MALEAVQSAITRLKGDVPGVATPGNVLRKIDRGRERMRKDSSAVELYWRFFRGDTYCWLDNKNILRFTSTQTSVGGGGKEPHRVRQAPNIIQPIIRHEVSAASESTPGYEISPTTMDPEDVAAASLSKRVAAYGYDKWNLRRVTQDVVTYTVVADMGFAWPYWDSSRGPKLTGQDVGAGEICVKTYGLNEVYWEPGLRFEDSPWHAVEQGRTIEAAEAIDGYLGGKLVPDAISTAYSDKAHQSRELVAVTEYLERPSAQYPEGRWLTLANGRVIAGIADVAGEKLYRPYPGDGGDEPCLIPLSYVEDPDSDRNPGLVRFLIDPQRTYQDAWSKILEWKNRALMPQILAPVGSMKGRRTDAPGAINYYIPVGGQIPQWERVPPIPPELFEIMQTAEQMVSRIGAQTDLPARVSSANAIQALIAFNATARQAFLANLATFHSRLMRRCLQLVQEHYSEARTLNIRGRLGWEPIRDFKGANLRDQVDVRVSPGSLTPMTHDQIQSKITLIAQLFPGYLSPEVAITALDAGTGEEIIADFEQHQARANRIIQRIKDGTLFDMPAIPNPKDPQNPVPGWMPRPFDRIDIHKHVFESYFTSEEWEMLPPDKQHASILYYDALAQLEAQKEAEKLALQSQMAAGLGAQNAARPGINPMPSLPGGAPAPGGSTVKP